MVPPAACSHGRGERVGVAPHPWRNATFASAAFLQPVLVTVQGRQFVRSLQRVDDDGSLVFYCAVEEGWILDIAGHEDMTEAFAGALAPLGPEAQFLLGFNCILRDIEAKTRGLHEALGGVMAARVPASLGFDTHGEASDGLHINQTFVGLALCDVA